MRAYTSRYMAEMPQQMGVNLATLERLNTQLRMNSEQQIRTIEQREKLLEGLVETGALARAAAGESAESLSNDVLARLQQIERMRKDLADLTTKFTDRHPDVARLTEQIAALEREVEVQKAREADERKREQAEQTASAATPVDPLPPQARRRTLDSLDVELARLQKDEAGIRESIAVYEQRLESTPERQQEYSVISRDYQAAKDLYDSLLTRTEEAEFAASVETDRQGERFRILEPALPPAGPSAPNRLRLLILSVLLALAAAVLAVIGAEQLDTSFHTVDDLREFTTVPVLATIPRIGGPGLGQRVRIALATVSVVAAITLVATFSAWLARGNEAVVRMLERAG